MTTQSADDRQPADALGFFGATGDLADKEIFPPSTPWWSGAGSTSPSSAWQVGLRRGRLRTRACQSLEQHGGVDPEAFAKLSLLPRYIDGDYRDRATFARLREVLGGARRPLYYLAIPPGMFATVSEGLAASGSARGARLLVEKPFGRDLASARALNRVLRKHLPESHVFWMDHFLGKEPVQSLLYLRFRQRAAGAAVERPLRARGADHHDRGPRRVGSRRLLRGGGRHPRRAPEPPAPGPRAARHVPAGRVRPRPGPRRAHPPAAGRPAAGPGRRGPRPVPRSPGRGRRHAGLHCGDLRRGQARDRHLALGGVPFYIRAGKRLPLTATEVVEFWRPPLEVFSELVGSRSNHLRLRLSPNMRIALGVGVKVAGEQMIREDVELVATDQPGEDRPTYERLLGDALDGDDQLFAREDTVEAEWQVVEPILGDAAPLYDYEPGGWGLEEADQLVGDGGWSDLTRRGRRRR